MKHDDGEVYEGLLIAVAMASRKKLRASLQYAGSGQYQSYPSGIIELGVALDSIDMFLADIINFVRANAVENQWITLGELPIGSLFITRHGTIAVKSEYRYPSGNQCECTIVGSGEYAYFQNGDLEVVMRIY